MPPRPFRSRGRQDTADKRREEHTPKSIHEEHTPKNIHGAAQKEPTESQLKRKLSFIDCSLAQIKDGILTEDPEWKFNSSFWHTILTESPHEGFKVIQNRTLAFWITVFNKWQEIKYPKYFDGHVLTEVFNVPKFKLLEIIKLFDQENYRRLQSEGPTATALARIQVNACEIMLTGVLLSRLITSKFKLRFAFGLVDLNDSQSLDEAQFSAFITTFINGMGAAYNICDDKSVMPSEGSIKTIASRLYARVSAIAGSRLKELHAAGDASTKAALVEAVRERKRRTTAMQSSSAAGGQTLVRQVVSYSTLEDWCFRVYKDPLALPYALAIERFCNHRFVGDDFWSNLERASEWYLSHKTPVIVPEDAGSAVGGERMLSRAEVIILRDIHVFALSSHTFSLTLKEIEEELKIDLSVQMWERIMPAMAKIALERHRPDLTSFFRYVCPWAQPMHIRMFESWIEQFDDLTRQKEIGAKYGDIAKTFMENQNKPVIPESELRAMDRDFDDLDKTSNGYLCVHDLSAAWNMDVCTLKEMFRKNDISDDGYIDKQDYLRLVCPEEYRLPEMSGEDRDLFGQLVLLASDRMNSGLLQKERLYEGTEDDDNDVVVGKTPASLLPEVPDEIWKHWNEVFARLDQNGDNTLDLKDLRESGLLSDEVCSFLCRILDPQQTTGFTKRSFLDALLDAHKYKKTGWATGAI